MRPWVAWLGLTHFESPKTELDGPRLPFRDVLGLFMGLSWAHFSLSQQQLSNTNFQKENCKVLDFLNVLGIF